MTNAMKQELIKIVKDERQLKEIMLENTILMFMNRGIINPSNIPIYCKTLNDNLDQNDETYVDLNTEETKLLSFSKLRIKFIFRKILTIKRVIDVEDFLDKKEYKIVIGSNISPKAEKQILEYKNVEFFNDISMQINLIDHILIPKHYKLNDEEKERFIKAYDYREYTSKRMFDIDPIAKYYNLKDGDIVRIERMSINSGISIDYRTVISAINK